MRKFWTLILIVCTHVFWVGPTYAAKWTLQYPRPIDENDRRHEYPLTLLKLALSKTGVRYTLSPSERILLPGKSLRLLKENREVNIVWVVTDSQTEKDLLPIRIPIHKGLSGWRVFLIHKDSQQTFANISSLQELVAFDALQGADWADTKILQSNGFNVLTVNDYTQAFRRLSAKKGDFFPRSVPEVLGELGSASIDPKIVLEPTIAIHYPTAMYFFVNRSNPTMARLIETGLRRSIDDGSFDALFSAQHREALAQVKVNQRKIFVLDNTNLSNQTPTQDPSLWFDPQLHSPNDTTNADQETKWKQHPKVL